MSANPIAGSYPEKPGYNQIIADTQPGKYNKSRTVTGSYYATGSFISSGVIRNTGGTGALHLYQSGSIDIASLTVGTVYELGVKRASVTAGSITLLQK
jgi:hypothetical protein